MVHVCKVDRALDTLEVFYVCQTPGVAGRRRSHLINVLGILNAIMVNCTRLVFIVEIKVLVLYLPTYRFIQGQAYRMKNAPVDVDAALPAGFCISFERVGHSSG